jgi:hypothetical protein
MVVNFRIYGISRNSYQLTYIPILIIKKKQIELVEYIYTQTLAWVLVLIRGSCRHLIFVDEDSLHLIILLKIIKITKEYAA